MQPAEMTGELYQAAAQLLVAGRNSYDVEQMLCDKGIDPSHAKEVVSELMQQVEQARKNRANKDMLYGALWCVGGTVLTLANVGFIFWGAILFGGIQFIRGVVNSVK